jgi:hypothetical protein
LKENLAEIHISLHFRRGGLRTEYTKGKHNREATHNRLHVSTPKVVNSILRNLLLEGSNLKLKEKKGKVIRVLVLTKHHAMKAYWGSGGIAPLIL